MVSSRLAGGCLARDWLAGGCLARGWLAGGCLAGVAGGALADAALFVCLSRCN